MSTLRNSTKRHLVAPSLSVRLLLDLAPHQTEVSELVLAVQELRPLAPGVVVQLQNCKQRSMCFMTYSRYNDNIILEFEKGPSEAL